MFVQSVTFTVDNLFSDSCKWLFSPLSRDLPVRGRYEVSGLPLDPLASPGGKLPFFYFKECFTCMVNLSYLSFCTLCMPYMCVKT